MATPVVLVTVPVVVEPWLDPGAAAGTSEMGGRGKAAVGAEGTGPPDKFAMLLGRGAV